MFVIFDAKNFPGFLSAMCIFSSRDSVNAELQMEYLWFWFD